MYHTMSKNKCSIYVYEMYAVLMIRYAVIKILL